MPLIDASYFDTTLPLVVSGNEEAINNMIESSEPEYLRAALGQSLFEAFMTGIETPTGVYFTNQFTDQFFKGNIADRWKWIRDGHVYTCGGVKYRWPGMQNVEKKSPVANYTYWYYLYAKNPSPSGTGGFTVPKMENAAVVAPYVPAMRAWNKMVEWNNILYRMITTLTDVDGAPLYPEFVLAELYYNEESINVFNRQLLF